MGNDIILSIIWGIISLCNGIMCLTLGYTIGRRRHTVINKTIYNYKVDGETINKKNDNIDFPNSRKK